MNNNIQHKVVSGGVVIREGKALILQRSENENSFPGMWELPSGKLEEGESIEEALLREVKEESGLDVEILKPVNTFEYNKEKEGQSYHYTQHNFSVRAMDPSQEVLVSTEHQAFAWVDSSDLNNYNLSDETRLAITTALTSTN